MSNYQYCGCGTGLNPTKEQIINNEIYCPDCGKWNDIPYHETLLKEVLVDMLKRIEKLESYDDKQRGI